jgi:hypothetical protein
VHPPMRGGGADRKTDHARRDRPAVAGGEAAPPVIDTSPAGALSGYTFVPRWRDKCFESGVSAWRSSKAPATRPRCGPTPRRRQPRVRQLFSSAAHTKSAAAGGPQGRRSGGDHRAPSFPRGPLAERSDTRR